MSLHTVGSWQHRSRASHKTRPVGVPGTGGLCGRFVLRPDGSPDTLARRGASPKAPTLASLLLAIARPAGSSAVRRDLRRIRRPALQPLREPPMCLLAARSGATRKQTWQALTVAERPPASTPVSLVGRTSWESDRSQRTGARSLIESGNLAFRNTRLVADRCRAPTHF